MLVLVREVSALVAPSCGRLAASDEETKMASITGTLGKVRVSRRAPTLGTRLGTAVDGLLERLGDGPDLISGDADSSLLAIARDLQLEDRALTRRVRRH